MGTTLAAAAEAADCELYLALISIEESGSAEHYGGGYRGRYDRWSEPDDDDFEIIEVYDRSAIITEWRCPDGSAPGLADLPFSEQELCPPDAFAELEPDEQLFHEATGNEGASFERSYRQAVFVLWPRARRLAVLSQGGSAATLPWLAELAQDWVTSGQGSDSDEWQDASTLADYILNDWPDHDWPRHQASERGETAAYLTSLTRLRDHQHIDAFAQGLATQGPCHRDDCEALLQALEQLPVDRAIELLEAIVTRNTPVTTGACTHLLTVATAAGFLSGRSSELALAASRLISALPADQNPADPGDLHRRNPIDTDLVIDLLTATAAISDELADRALHHLVSNPCSFDTDALLVTAALRLAEQPENPGPPVMEQLQHRVLTHLRARIAEPLAPPEDWRRNRHVTCDCNYCHDLSRFLAAPDQGTWKLKAAEAERRHVEYSIKQDKCDLDCHTEKKGRPYTLVCSKNQGSYLRRVEQRRQDLETLDRLVPAAGT